jgi:hypothetical protein
MAFVMREKSRDTVFAAAGSQQLDGGMAVVEAESIVSNSHCEAGLAWP